jgi:GT2 family glycosyltransferase
MQIDREKYRVIQSIVHGELPQISEAADPVVSGWVDYASWLSDDSLLIVGWFHGDAEDPPQASLVLGDRAIPLDTCCISYPRPIISDGDPRAGKLLTVHFRSREDARGPLGSMVIRTNATPFALGPLDLSQAVTDLHTLVRDGLTQLAPETRVEIMEFLAAALMGYRAPTNHSNLNKNLFTVREALRERLPLCMIAPDQAQGIHVDALLAVNEKSFYIKGWMRDAESKITQLTMVSPEGSRAQLVDRIFQHPRIDVEQFYGATIDGRQKAGIIAYFEIKAPSYLPTGWTIQMRNAAGIAVEALAPPVIRDPVTVRNSILGDLVRERLPCENLMLNHVFPAISRLQEQLQDNVGIDDVVQYGAPNQSTDVSIIVPLYGRIDFLEQQLAQFVHDPEIHLTDLIYVLDSPELADSLKDAAAQLFRLYRIPFRVATLKRNAGYSAANNVGVSLARGRLLLLLNSDVLPDRTGWLGMMTTFYDATPGIGALGPKLLYEDDSLQHAGMYFSRLASAGVWENRHYFKGLHRSLPAANVLRPVPAVTGACLMVDSTLYKQVGGLRGTYVQGDHEDSDLCLRLIEAGYENWYLPAAELYHLEGQSYPGALRQLTSQYNAWLHTRLWNEHIERVMARYANSTD